MSARKVAKTASSMALAMRLAELVQAFELGQSHVKGRRRLEVLGELVEDIWQDGFMVGAGGLPRKSPVQRALKVPG